MAFLLVLIPLIAGLAPLAGLASALMALAIGHHSSVTAVFRFIAGASSAAVPSVILVPGGRDVQCGRDDGMPDSAVPAPARRRLHPVARLLWTHAGPCEGVVNRPTDIPIDIEDPQLLHDYLRRTSRIGADEQIRARVLAGGVSNRTVLVERESGESWVLKQALSKLRVPVDWFCEPERISREALGMQALARVAPRGSITPLVFCDESEHILAMEAVPEPHRNWKSMLLEGDMESDHFRQFGVLLRAIQSAPHDAGFDDRSYFEKLRVEPYYSYAASQVPLAASFLERLIDRTRSTRTALVHGDFSPKNVLVHGGRLVLLDHEVIHWGDPAFDVGFAMAHFLSKAGHLPQHRVSLIIGAKLMLAQLTTLPPGSVEHTLGCLLARVAGRSQLEYLSDDEKRAQRERVLSLMSAPPTSLEAFIEAW